MLTKVFVKVDSCDVFGDGCWLTVAPSTGLDCARFVRGVEMKGFESLLNSVNTRFVCGVEMKGSYHTPQTAS